MTQCHYCPLLIIVFIAFDNCYKCTIGLAGSNAVDNLELFSIVDAAADAWVHIYDATFHEKDEKLKVLQTTVPKTIITC